MAFELQNGTKYFLINTRKVGQDYGCCTGITADVFGTDFFFFGYVLTINVVLVV